MINKFSIAVLLFLGMTLHAYANPQGVTVVSGSATFNNSSPNTFTVTTTSDKTIINYNSFSIAADESTIFNQPNSNSAVLNRVVGIDPSLIYGNLSSNGKLFLVNPNGVIFGPGSQVNAPAIVASTLDIKNDDFLNGNYVFFKNGHNASIINQGRIAAQPGGYVALLSQAVNNQGVILADSGTIALASGNKMTLGLDSLDQISVVVDDAVKSKMRGPNSRQVNLTGKLMNDALDYAVNNSGIIEAGTIENKGGVIELTANKASITNTGSLSANSINLFSKGNIYSQGSLQSVNLMERGNTFQVGGIFDPGQADIKNTDNAIVYSANTFVSGIITDAANIIVDPNITLTMTADTSFVAGGAFAMDPTSTIDGKGNDLSITAGNDSALGNINNVNLFTLSSGSGADVTFTSNPNSTFDVDTVKTNYHSILSRSVGTGTAADPIIIYSDSNAPGGLQYIPTSGLGLYYQQANNIDAFETSNWDGGTGFLPIGNYFGSFTGLFNGEGLTISNLMINNSFYNAGLFGNTSATAVLSNINLVNNSVTGAFNVGGLVGYNQGTIINSSSNGNVNGATYVGGLVGYDDNGSSISNSSSNGNVAGLEDIGGVAGYNLGSINGASSRGKVSGVYYNVGGLAGYNAGNITGSSSTCSVSGTGQIGGLVGSNVDGSSINNSYSTGNVMGSDSAVGGLVGYNWGAISSSYSTGNVDGEGSSLIGGLVGADFGSSITDSYSTGNVSSTGYFVGGLVGLSTVPITNSYSSGDVNGGSYVGGLVGLNMSSVADSFTTGNVTGSGTNIGGLTGSTNGPITNSYFTDNAYGSQGGGTYEPEDAAAFSIWTGAASSDWFSASNWLGSAVPSAGESVVIGAGSYNPVLSSNISSSSVVVESGAVFDPATFTITGTNLDSEGTLLVNAPTFAGNYAFSSVPTLGPGSTVNYAGLENQAIDHTLPYFNLITSGSGTKTLDGTTNVSNTIVNNSTVDLNGQSLTVNNSLTNNGTLKLIGNETPSIGEFIDNGTTDYYGSGTYTITPLGAYNNLQFDNGTFILGGTAAFIANGNIIINPNVTFDMIADTSFMAGKAITMDPTVTINGGGHDLSFSAASASTLGLVNNVNQLTISPILGEPVSDLPVIFISPSPDYIGALTVNILLGATLQYNSDSFEYIWYGEYSSNWNYAPNWKDDLVPPSGYGFEVDAGNFWPELPGDIPTSTVIIEPNAGINPDPVNNYTLIGKALDDWGTLLVYAAKLTDNYNFSSGGIKLELGSTVNYASQKDQIIAPGKTGSLATDYYNLVTSGSGSKILDGPTSVLTSLTINEGSTFDLSGQNLTVGNLTNEGTLKLMGNETTIITGAFTDDGLTDYYGSGSYIIAPLGISYSDLQFDNGTFGLVGIFSADGKIAINSNVILLMASDMNLMAGKEIDMDPTATIEGFGNNLSLTAGKDSTLGNINNVGLFTLNSGTGADVTFTSNPNSIFEVDTVKTNYHSIFSRNVGTGTAADPIMIYSDSNAPGGLQYIPTRGLGLYYQQANNIDASETSNWNGGTGFTPIGNDSTPFLGNFNGDNNTISNLYIDLPSGSFVGLFGYTYPNSNISNVGIEDENITGHDYVGGLVGVNYGSITNSYDTGNISGVYVAGGLAGYNDGSITDSFNLGNIFTNGIQTYAGGLVGKNYGSIANSYNLGDISASGAESYLGGLVGENDGSIANSYNLGNISASGTYSYLGGLVGFSDGLIMNSYNAENVSGSGSSWIGGLVAYNNGPITSSYNTGIVSGANNESMGGLVGFNDIDGEITNSNNSGNISGDQFYIGGLVGNNDGSIIDSFNTGDVSGVSKYEGGLVGINSDNGSIENSSNDGAVEDTYAGEDAFHEGDSVGGLAGGNFGSIAMSYNTGNISGESKNEGGLVGYNDGSITNSYNINDIVGNGSFLGGLVGTNFGGSIADSYNEGDVSGGNNSAFIGGLVGSNNENGSITNSNNAGTVSGGIDSYIGGLAGDNSYGLITYSDTTGNIYGSDLATAGGLVGFNTGSVADSNNSGSIFINGSDVEVGGLLGVNDGYITNSNNSGNIAIIGVYEEVGGLIGLNAGSLINSNNSGNISGSNYDNIDEWDSVGGLVGGNASNASIVNSFSTGIISGFQYTGPSSAQASILSSYNLTIPEYAQSFLSMKLLDSTSNKIQDLNSFRMNSML